MANNISQDLWEIAVNTGIFIFDVFLLANFQKLLISTPYSLPPSLPLSLSLQFLIQLMPRPVAIASDFFFSGFPKSFLEINSKPPSSPQPPPIPNPPTYLSVLPATGTSAGQLARILTNFPISIQQQIPTTLPSSPTDSPFP
ncbi:hypothetical protein HK096_011559 [Nowakowskiella sp. JEL0078]|nr:hypothetical protein HK096_011559 [Nowakowskiella sp. JEL0078]